MKIDFYLMGYKGLEVLRAVCKSDRNVINAVISARDKNLEDDSFEAIKALCLQYDIVFFDRLHSKTSVSDCRFVIGWRWLIEEIDNTIILHDSLLPQYRGFAPLVNALINGDPQIGATALRAQKEYDIGPIIAQKAIAIDHPIRIQTAIGKVSELYIELVQGMISQLTEGKLLKSFAQDETKASYSLWRDEYDYMINWSDDNEKILRTIYALSHPYKGAHSLLNGEKVIIEDASLVKDVDIVNRQPGKVIFLQDDKPVIVCGKGLLKITSAFNPVTGVSILPLKQFRVRFGT